MTSTYPDKYDGDIDFERLSTQDEDFARLYQEANGKLDFQDPTTML